MERRDEETRSSWSPALQPVAVLEKRPVAAAGRRERVGVFAGDTGGSVRTVGRYALHAEIASGGMATVHIGRLLGPVGFARTVAIKRLHPPLAKDPEFVAMFLDEARLAARIRHPNVVSTLDVVATEGELFVVMEYVPGESLARLLRAVRANKQMVPVPIAATIMVGVLHGLHAAHEARDERGAALRIVHRDVSPHNILVGTDGDAHVIDFGIAKARGRMQVTRQGQIKGKLSYMPAEQLLGQPLDQRADIFAASIVLWEALTGQRLFQGIDDGEVYAKVLVGNVDPPSLHARDLTPEMDGIVLRGLARDKTKRFSTAREMALALEAAIPLAPPSQVGRWVELLVGDLLAERTIQIAGIERSGDGEGALTSSGLLSIQSTGCANEDLTAGDARAVLSSHLDRTPPTARVAAVGADVHLHATAVDRPMRTLAIGDAAFPAADKPRRRTGRAAIALLLISLACYGTWRARRTAPAESVARAAAQTHGLEPQEPSSAAPLRVDISTAPLAPPINGPMPEARPTLPAATGLPIRKTAPAVPGARPVTPRVAPQPQEPALAAPSAHANGASCDPPFWIDSDGTKRYNRRCANL